MTPGVERVPGTTVAGRYALVRRLGSGGSGEVWRADDLQERRAVALKRLHLPFLPAERLEREAALVGALDHPLIVKSAGLVRDGAGVWLVQEFVAGGDARQLRGRPWSQWVQVLLDVATALEAAHAAGLVHLDLNPGNVLLDVSGSARLADFGVARALGASGMPAGSPYARSPAQWRGEPAEPADDAYGLGALAYEWLTGHPPYYPDITAARVLAGLPPPPRSPSAPPPPELPALVMRLLASNPAERPALGAVRECLSALIESRKFGQDFPPLLPPKTLLEPPPLDEASSAEVFLQPPDLDPPSWAAATRFRWRLPRPLLGALLAFVAVAAVLSWTPASDPVPVKSPSPTAALAAVRTTAPKSTAASPRVTMDPAELARMAERKSAADEYRSAYRRERERLAKLPVTAWAETAWQQATAVDGTAQAFYDKLDFEQAGEAWRDGLSQLRNVAAARMPALAVALAAGESALAKPDARTARQHFARALAIQPGHQGATAGLRRADVLDAVTHLLDQAGLDERSGRFTAAVGGYRRALALDGTTVSARSGLARVQLLQAEAAWRSTLAEAWQHLGAGRRDVAKAGFERAGRMRPGAPEVAEGLAQVESGNRTARLAGLKSRAMAAEHAERWAEAEGLYREALEAEPGLSFAREGSERSAARGRLDVALQNIIDDPKQVLRPARRGMARVWLEQAGQQSAPRIRLQKQVATVTALLVAAETPLPLVIESDGETQVTVMRVRRLGPIIRETVSVQPGMVTVVGTRPGYRDIRRELEVLPGVNHEPVRVSCEERI